jgi:hypothetical protein
MNFRFYFILSLETGEGSGLDGPSRDRKGTVRKVSTPTCLSSVPARQILPLIIRVPVTFFFPSDVVPSQVTLCLAHLCSTVRSVPGELTSGCELSALSTRDRYTCAH